MGGGALNHGFVSYFGRENCTKDNLDGDLSVGVQGSYGILPVLYLFNNQYIGYRKCASDMTVVKCLVYCTTLMTSSTRYQIILD